MDGKSVIGTFIRWAREYNECAARHNSLVEAVAAKAPK